MNFIRGMISENDGTPSSKRLIGVIGGLSLIVNMFINMNDYNVNVVLILTLSSIGVTGVEKIVSSFKK